MAELLITTKDTPNFYKYDIIAVRDDNFQWGRYECWDNFLVVRINGKTADDVAYLIEPEYYTDPSTGELRVGYNRKYYYNYDVHLPKTEIEKVITSNWYIPTINLGDVGVKVWQQ